MQIKLNETIRKLRTERGITQKELADGLGISPQSVSRWEKGQAYPDMEMLPKLADFFHVSVDELMGRGSSFLAQKREELHAAWDAVCGERDFWNRQKVCDILEELASHGNSQVEFFRVARELERNDRAKPGQVERARKYCREMLERLGANDRIAWLGDILPCEDEGKLDLWRAYVPSYRFTVAWDEVLLDSYPHSSDKRKKQQQTVMFHSVERLLYRSLQVHDLGGECSYEHNKRTLDMLNLYSKEAGDIFLSFRISCETWVAVSLLSEGRLDEGFDMLDTVLEHLRLACELRGKCARGSIPELALVEKPASLAGASFDVSFVQTVMKKRPELDAVRGNARFIAFCRAVNRLGDGASFMMSREAEEAFRKLLSSAGETADALGKGEWAVTLITSKGNFYGTVLHSDESGRWEDDSLSARLADADDRVIQYLVGMDFLHNLAVPPYELISALADLAEENKHAQGLCRNGLESATYKLERVAFMSEDACREAHKFCTNHSDKLKKDSSCGCFHCLAIFSPDKIERWMRDKKKVGKGSIEMWRCDEQLTAFCPYCGVDSVIGESSGFPISKSFLRRMKRYWFNE